MSKEAHLRQVDGITFVARANSNHWVVMDGSSEFGGSLAGSTPKELVLMALAGCTASDVIPILRKKRVALEKFEIHVRANERDEHPRIFTDIHVEYVFHGNNLNTTDLERAIELSTTKYCSVSAILRASATLTHSYRVESTDPRSSSST